MFLKTLIWAEVYGCCQMLSKFLVQNNCPDSMITSLKMRPSWGQAWAPWSLKPHNFTKTPRSRRLRTHGSRERSQGYPSLSWGWRTFSKVWEGCGSERLCQQCCSRGRVQPSALNKTAGEGGSQACASQDPRLPELSSGGLQLFLSRALMFPEEADPGQARGGSKADTSSWSHLSVASISLWVPQPQSWSVSQKMRKKGRGWASCAICWCLCSLWTKWTF